MSGVRVVVIRQLDLEALNIAELQVFSGGVEVGRSAKCYSFPVGGDWYDADVDGSQPFLNDGLMSTFSHSGDLGDGQVCTPSVKRGSRSHVTITRTCADTRF